MIRFVAYRAYAKIHQTYMYLGVSAVVGYPRSIILVPIESVYATSY